MQCTSYAIKRCTFTMYYLVTSEQLWCIWIFYFPSQRITFSYKHVTQWCCYGTQMTLDTLEWRHNGHGGVSNHQPDDCLLNRLFRPRSKKTLKLRVTGLCVGNSPVTGEFPAQMASNAENVSIWWRHHAFFWAPLTAKGARGSIILLSKVSADERKGCICNNFSLRLRPCSAIDRRGTRRDTSPNQCRQSQW